MQELTPLLAGISFALAAIAFVWFGVQDRVLGGQRLARRLFGATRQAIGSFAGAKLEQLVSEDSALRRFEKFLTPDDEERSSRLRTKLALAGYRNTSAVRIYFA